jgi:predicted NACHT family NTPase
MMINLQKILERQRKLFNQKALACYIPSNVIREIGDEPKDAYEQIQIWLRGKKSTLLLLGDSGAGKTLFNQWLTQILFEIYLDSNETGCERLSSLQRQLICASEPRCSTMRSIYSFGN